MFLVFRGAWAGLGAVVYQHRLGVLSRATTVGLYPGVDAVLSHVGVAIALS